MKRSTNIFDLDQLARLLGLPTSEEFHERLTQGDDTYGWTYREAIKEGKTEEAAEEAALEAEGHEHDEYYRKHNNAVLAAAEHELGEHSLCLDQGPNDWSWRIKPVKDWKDSADKIRETVDGYGMFVFGGLRAFLEAGPYTPREATLSHLHWMRERWKVYSCSTENPSSIYDRQM